MPKEGLTTDTIELLISEAKKARQLAYAPYSGFYVGAALLTKSGKIYTGCNIESAAQTPTCCAERVAFFKAVSEGEHKFRAIAVLGGKKSSKISKLCAPCGVCRQVMQEFCDENEFEIILSGRKEKAKIFKLKELLPLGFGADDLN